MGDIGDGTIEELNSSGVGTVFTTGLSNPSGMTFDSAGNLYIGIQGNETIEKYSSTGGGLSSNGTVFANSGVYNPFEMAFDNAGNLYLAGK